MTRPCWAALPCPLFVAACGGVTSASVTDYATRTATATATPAATATPSSAISSPAALQPPSAGTCPATYTGERVHLGGTLTYVLPIGGHYVASVKDSAGHTCQLVTHTDPGKVGATVSVQDYVAYISPGIPPTSQVAPADYAAGDH